MGFAIIEDGKVINTAAADADYAASQGWVPLPRGVGIGWSYVNGKFIDERPVSEPVTAPTKEELLAQLQALQAQITALGE